MTSHEPHGPAESLASLRDGYRAVVFGASGGIGGSLVRLLADDPRSGLVHAGARRALAREAKIEPFTFDLLEESTIAEAAQNFGEGVDLVVTATGVLHDEVLKPEKSLRALDGSMLGRSFALNAIGPALVAKHFLPLLKRDHKTVFAALSARVGSIADNRSGGWHAYRASKAALNQLVRTCAIELAHRNRQAVCAALHPGTVDTLMSKPFQAGVAADKLFTARTSAAHLLRTLDSLSAADSGGFFAWDGQPIPF